MTAPNVIGGSAKHLTTAVGFSRGVLGHDIWRAQRAILESVACNRRTAVKSCNSSGKTFVAADAVLWWITMHPDGIAVTTAPGWTQVRTLLWGKIRENVSKSRVKYPNPPLQTELKISEGNYAIGISTKEASRFSGFHAGKVLIVMDEAQGVRQEIWNAVQGLRAGGEVSLLVIGNPLTVGGPYYDAFHGGRAGWSTFTLSAFDTPNLQHVSLTYQDERGAHIVAGRGPDLMELDDKDLDWGPRPYLCTRRWVREMYEEWGATHPYFQSRVLAEFPEQGDDTLIPLLWLERCKEEEDAPTPVGRVTAGLDVAGPGEAETVLKVRCGERLVLSKAWTHSDPRGDVVAAMLPYKQELERLNVDCVGIGWGMYTHLRDIFGEEVVKPINVGTEPRDKEKFVNAKAEYYWGVRMRAQAGSLKGLDDKTIGQLTAIRYRQNPRGQIVIEGKEEMRRRGIKSPDHAEALMLAFIEPPRRDELALPPIHGIAQRASFRLEGEVGR